MKFNRYFASAAVFNGYIYIAGGIIEGRNTNLVELYDPKTHLWAESAPMIKTRESFTLTASNGFLYAMGFDKAVERFCPSQNRWTEVCELKAVNDKLNAKFHDFVSRFRLDHSITAILFAIQLMLTASYTLL